MKVGTELVDPLGNPVLSGGHTFSMKTPDGEDNVAACAPCHSFETFADVSIEFNGTKDLDGDGTEEGLQIEVDGLLEMLHEVVPTSERWGAKDSTITLAEAQAYYNYEAILEDRSRGIHNPKFAVNLLYASLEALGHPVGVEKTNSLPVNYNLAQNFPNPFNPTTVINFSIPEAGIVTITVFDALGREVTTLVNKNMSAGSYKADWDATNYSAGIYFYSIKVNNYAATKKMVLLK